MIARDRKAWHHIRRAVSVVLRMGVAAEESWQEHEEIIAGLLKQDVEAAEAAMRRHIDNAQHKTIGMLLRK